METYNLDLNGYAHLYAKIHCQCGTKNTITIMDDLMVVTLLNQYHISKGIKMFGQTGVKYLRKEPKQLHDKMVMYLKNLDEHLSE